LQAKAQGEAGAEGKNAREANGKEVITEIQYINLVITLAFEMKL
jgi:hypothetical protein